DAVAAVELELSDKELAALQEPYTAHPVIVSTHQRSPPAPGAGRADDVTPAPRARRLPRHERHATCHDRAAPRPP
ncbi:hypothetical protein, partial [Streptomyces nigra]